MSGSKDLDLLLNTMEPELRGEEYVFCSFPGARYADHAELNPIAMFAEPEGLSLIVEKSVAVAQGIAADAAYRLITLTVHSSLEAVGLTAAISTRLTEAGISANVVAACLHDHIFVPSRHAEKALGAIQSLQRERRT